MGSVIVAGGGLAGMASAAALYTAGFQVEVFEARGYPGGRATSYSLPGEDALIDNCQHILLRCCVNLIDFYQRLGVADKIRFYREFYFIEPGGGTSVLRGGPLPAPLHLMGSFLRLGILGLSDKFAIARALMAVRRDRLRRRDLDRVTILDWLNEQGQTPAAIARFWRPILVSAINEEPERIAALHGLQCIHLGFLASSCSYEMGVPSAPLSELYRPESWSALPGVFLRLRAPVDRILVENGRAVGVHCAGEQRLADAVICAVPFERVHGLVPDLNLDFTAWEHSPITGIHLWFDRPVTGLPHATLLERTIQWFFNKSGGRYLQIVVSASRNLVEMPRSEVIDLAVRELGEFLPSVRAARLERAHVVKEIRATFSARPGLQALRPEPRTAIGGLYLAGDWTRTAWPATMEGAVRSGYRAAEAVAADAGVRASFLLPDIG